MTISTSLRGLVLGGAIAAGGISEARAAESDVAAAQALFDEGRELMRAGRYAEACPKFEDSDRLAPGIGTEFNLADCYEHTGRLASAWALFLKVAAATKLKGQLERERVARERALALEPKLARLEVRAPANTPGLQIERDGRALPESSWGMALPVDRGPHEISARAPGKATWSTTAMAYDGRLVQVSVPDLSEGDGSSAGTTGPMGASAARAEGSRSDTRRTLAWVAAGGAVTLFGVGVFGLVKHADATSSPSPQQNEGPCLPIGKSGKTTCDKEDGESGGTGGASSHWDTVAIAGFVGGGILAVTSAALFLITPSDGPNGGKKPATSRTFGCGPGPGAFGVACRATF